jgi:hypothetical protein
VPAFQLAVALRIVRAGADVRQACQADELLEILGDAIRGLYDRPAERLGAESRSLPARDAEEMSAVFADSFYFIAQLNPVDEAHKKATAFTASFGARW